MIRIVLPLALASLMACRHHPPTVPVPTGPTLTSSTLAPVPAPSIDAATQAAIDEIVANFQRVHFGLDSSSLDAGEQALIARNADILRAHPDIRVEIQGHADERGTVDYNLALGMRRADTVARSLRAMGVPDTRVRTISYGEERPRASGATEVAWAENRRCEFRVTAGNGVGGTVN